MTESRSSSSSRVQALLGWVLLALGVIVFAVRIQHEGAYAMPRGGPLIAGVGGLLIGALLVSSAGPGWLRWVGVAVSPIVLFLGLYATMAEFEEVISLYAKDSSGQPVNLRLWVVDREDGEWVGMPRTKAVEHSLDGSQVEILRDGETRCVVPVLFEDREVVGAIHAQKVDKYAVARMAAAIGLYPREARDSAVSLRLDPCPQE